MIDDVNGRTLVAASSIDSDLRTDLEGLSKTEQASKIGEAIAQRTLDQGIQQVVFDRGGYQYIGRVKALADSARKAGLKF